MPKMQLRMSGVGAGTPDRRYETYSGPPLVGGTYVVKLKRMVHKQIGYKDGKRNPQYNGNNLGADRFELVMEVVGPEHHSQFIGAPIFDGLNVIDGFGAQMCNEFLHAIAGATTQAQRAAAEKAFYETELVYENVDFQGNKTTHIKKIGKLNINSPKGELLLRVVVRPDTKSDRPRVQVSQYLPYDGEGVVNKAAASEDAGDDLLAEINGGGGELIDFPEQDGVVEEAEPQPVSDDGDFVPEEPF